MGTSAYNTKGRIVTVPKSNLKMKNDCRFFKTEFEGEMTDSFNEKKLSILIRKMFDEEFNIVNITNLIGGITNRSCEKSMNQKLR